jgi:hypothetical protein
LYFAIDALREDLHKRMKSSGFGMIGHDKHLPHRHRSSQIDRGDACHCSTLNITDAGVTDVLGDLLARRRVLIDEDNRYAKLSSKATDVVVLITVQHWDDDDAAAIFVFAG